MSDPPPSHGLPPRWDPRFDPAVRAWLRSATATGSVAGDGDDARDDGYMPHQRAVARLFRPGSGVRGLVLLHGVGSGKTCAASAVWAALTASNGGTPPRLRVFAPASTHGNFVSTLLRCGHGRWARRARAGGDSWAPDADGVAVDDMSDEDRAALESFVRRDSDGGDAFTSTNGLTDRAVRALGAAGRNALDDSLIVVDEAHHLARALYNAAAKGDGRTTAAAGAGARTFKVYDKIRTARRARVLVLTGTPVQNHPVELAYLVNMALGATREYVFRWIDRVDGNALARVRERLRRAEVARWFDASDSFLRVREVRGDSGGDSVSASASAFGFGDDDDEFDADAGRNGAARNGAATAARVSLAVGRALAGVASCELVRRVDRDAVTTDAREFEAAFVDDRAGAARNLVRLAHVAAGAVSVFDPPPGDRVPIVTERRVVRLEMSDLQARQYVRARKHEKRRARSGDDAVYRHFSRSACNFAFPPTSAGVRLMRFEQRDMSDAQYERYTARHVRALVDDGLVRDRDAMRAMSPKFFEIVRRVRYAEGRSLVFSSFRAVEGVGLLSSVLIQTGWRQLAVKDGALTLVPRASGTDGPVFACPDMSGRHATALVDAINGNVAGMDARIAAQWDRLGRPDVKVVVLSKSGAEGITFKRVRHVHITEPHWNHAVPDQVVGRAVRVDAHADLDPRDRTVDVFTYVCVAPEDADRVPGLAELGETATSDEEVLAVADRKRAATEGVLNALGRAAVDCELWRGRDAGCARRDDVWDPDRAGAVADARILNLDGRRIAVFPDDSRGVYDGDVWTRDRVALRVGTVADDGEVTWTSP